MGLPVKREKKSVNFGPHQRIMVTGPRETTTNKRDVHKALLKNELGELQHSWGQMGAAGSLAWESNDVKITPDTP
jgi:hypothetical protein